MNQSEAGGKKPVVKGIKWRESPEEKDYPAAESYLQLIFEAKTARRLVKRLKRAEVIEFAVKDVLRASQIPISEVRAFDCGAQLAEIRAGVPLSPLLLVRREDGANLIIADGFHRLCAAFSLDEHCAAACKII